VQKQTFSTYAKKFQVDPIPCFFANTAKQPKKDFREKHV